MEKEQGCLEGLMVCPVGRDVIYVGKMLATLIFMLFVEAVTMLIFSVLFNIGVFSAPLIVVTVLGTVGFASVGTLFSALAVNTRAREMVMPVLFLPVVVPVIIAAVKATGLVLSGESWGGIASWLQIIGAFDIIFIVASVLVFAYVIEE
jgi:heme exporter protein B